MLVPILNCLQMWRVQLPAVVWIIIKAELSNTVISHSCLTVCWLFYMWWIQKKYVKVLQKFKKLISWTSFILLKLLIVMWSRIFYVLFYILNIIIWLQRQMLQYLWLCDTNHLKREELRENQNEREGGRKRERERRERGRGKTCILMSCTFPHHRYKVNALFSLKLQFHS